MKIIVGAILAIMLTGCVATYTTTPQIERVEFLNDELHKLVLEKEDKI